MTRRILRFVPTLLACALVPQVFAATSTALDAYLAGVRTLRAEFTQQVTDGRGGQVQRANGSLVILRPGRFRWELTPVNAAGAKQTPQLMVADGKNLWFYDRDLDQVSVKPAASALTATPASLLSGDGKLGEFFDVHADGQREGLTWVRVVPKRGDADFREVQIGFKGTDELKRMVLKDKLGQTVRLDFNVSARNVPVTDTEVKFSPPAGADVIGTPVP
ncbi:MAG TPA: outer membrane lipoprotein chaperone LolA [Steroidobacteraceae bacterium]